MLEKGTVDTRTAHSARRIPTQPVTYDATRLGSPARLDNEPAYDLLGKRLGPPVVANDLQRWERLRELRERLRLAPDAIADKHGNRLIDLL